MRFSKLVFVVTDDCNYECSYCRQKKEKNYMQPATLEKAIPFFYPFLEEEATVIFFGGEPLLAFDIMKYAVSLLREQQGSVEKKLKLSLTTNGSLITAEILDFFNMHGFYVLLSFDGTVQEINRKSGSLVSTQELIRRLQSDSYPGIKLTTNSVFTPRTVLYLAESLRLIIESGVKEIQFSLDETVPWHEADLLTLEDQLAQLRDFLVSYYKENRMIPLGDFRPPEPGDTPVKLFVCAGGNDRITITPAEDLWGCVNFHGYLKDKQGSDEFRTYSLGKLDDFRENHETLYQQWLDNCADLKQDFFFTEKQFCFLCEYVEQCRVCPVYAAEVTSRIGKIPSWICAIKRILRKEQREFLKIIDRIDSQVMV